MEAPARHRGRTWSFAQTLTAAILGVAVSGAWLATALGFLAVSSLVGEAPPPPDASVLPLPEGWTVVADTPCGGSHCSTRDLQLDGPRGTSDAVCDQFTRAFDEAGWSIRPPGCERYGRGGYARVDGELGGLSGGIDWSIDEDGNASAIEGLVGFYSDEAGDAYYGGRLRRWFAGSILLTVVAVAVVLIWRSRRARSFRSADGG